MLFHDIEVSTFQIIQLVTFLVVSFAGYVVREISKTLKGLREDIAKERERFKEYVRNEQCNAHRLEIERHIKDSEARIEKLLAHCKNHGKSD